MENQDELDRIRKRIDEILGPDGGGTKKRRLPPSATVSQMMGADITEYDQNSQFRITNERMLAVRDDLTNFINANFGRLARETVAQISAQIAAPLKGVVEQSVELQRMVVDVQGQLSALREEMNRRWYRRAWRWVVDRVLMRSEYWR